MMSELCHLNENIFRDLLVYIIFPYESIEFKVLCLATRTLLLLRIHLSKKKIKQTHSFILLRLHDTLTLFVYMLLTFELTENGHLINVSFVKKTPRLSQRTTTYFLKVNRHTQTHATASLFLMSPKLTDKLRFNSFYSDIFHESSIQAVINNDDDG